MNTRREPGSCHTDRDAVSLMEDSMRAMVIRLAKDDAGQDLIEYALLAAFVALGSVVALQTLGPAIKGLFDTVVTKIGLASTP